MRTGVQPPCMDAGVQPPLAIINSITSNIKASHLAWTQQMVAKVFRASTYCKAAQPPQRNYTLPYNTFLLHCTIIKCQMHNLPLCQVPIPIPKPHIDINTHTHTHTDARTHTPLGLQAVHSALHAHTHAQIHTYTLNM